MRRSESSAALSQGHRWRARDRLGGLGEDENGTQVGALNLARRKLTQEQNRELTLG
jgi:hypothetical protein